MRSRVIRDDRDGLRSDTSRRFRLLAMALVFLFSGCGSPERPDDDHEPVRSELDVSGEPFDPSDAVDDDDTASEAAPPPDSGARIGG